jgi:hypothetical protein
LSLPKDVLDKPIPSLTERQYVVDKNKRSAHQVKAERELFWYREGLLKRVTATWVEVSGDGVDMAMAVAVVED